VRRGKRKEMREEERKKKGKGNRCLRDGIGAPHYNIVVHRASQRLPCGIALERKKEKESTPLKKKKMNSATTEPVSLPLSFLCLCELALGRWYERKKERCTGKKKKKAQADTP